MGPSCPLLGNVPVSVWSTVERRTVFGEYINQLFLEFRLVPEHLVVG